MTLVSVSVFLLSIPVVFSLAISPAQSFSQELNLAAHHNTSSLFSSGNSTFRVNNLKNDLEFICDAEAYGDGLDMDSVVNAWRRIPRNPTPLIFSGDNDGDVKWPKRFPSRRSSFIFGTPGTLL